METSGSTSTDLIHRARDGEAGAWERIVEMHAGLVHHVCRQAGLDHDTAGDVFQEVFAAAARGIHSFEQKPGGTFRGWLRAIAVNKVRDHQRRRAGTPLAIGGTSIQRRVGEVPAPRVRRAGSTVVRPESDEQRRVRLALARVRERVAENTWRAFERCVLDGQQPVDVAAELGMTPGAVRVAKSRLLQRLRRELDADRE